MTDIEKQINLVVEARTKSKLLAEARKSMYDEFMSRHTDFFADVATASSEVGIAEEALRQMAIDFYAETGEKQVAQGIVIKVGTSIEYSKDDAMAWALDHKLAIQLDVKAFEKMAKASPNGFGFVEITPEPKATIATELQVIE